MKIIATADMHGRLPKIPECDLLIIAGDVCPVEDHKLLFQLHWLDSIFRGWLEVQPAKSIVGIAGNHDFVFEKMAVEVKDLHLPWSYLEDSTTDVDGINIYGLPWVPNLEGWAFYGSIGRLREAYGAVSEDTDIVISHGPPKGHLDNKLRQFGASQANDMLKRVKPKAFICGHVHEGYGIERGYRKTTDIYNVSHCDITYHPVNPPVKVSWQRG